MSSLWRAKRGSFGRSFTLIELLVVITIIGILITLVMVSVVPIQRKSRDARRKADVNNLLSAANLFKADFKVYPNTTFNLGDQGNVNNGDVNSNFGVSGDVFNCNNAPLGTTTNFSTSATPTIAQLDDKGDNATKIKLKPGFVSVNNFLICLKYTSSLLSDPKPATASNQDKYQYRVSYDYGDVVITALLENSNETDASRLFNQNPPKRYYKGSGVVVRHLDDDSDSDSVNSGDANYNFFSTLPTTVATINDGKYLYQCKRKSSDSSVIKPDDRVTYEPIISGTGSYSANSACNNAVVDLDVIQAY